MKYLIGSDRESPNMIYFINDDSDLKKVLKKADNLYLDLFNNKGVHTRDVWKFNYHTQGYDKI